MTSRPFSPPLATATVSAVQGRLQACRGGGLDGVSICNAPDEVRTAFLGFEGTKNVLGLNNYEVLLQEFLHGTVRRRHRLARRRAQVRRHLEIRQARLPRLSCRVPRDAAAERGGEPGAARCDGGTSRRSSTPWRSETARCTLRYGDAARAGAGRVQLPSAWRRGDLASDRGALPGLHAGWGAVRCAL